MTNFDPTKPVQTRDGRPARIICTDRKSSSGQTITALILSRDGQTEHAIHYFPNGRDSASTDCPYDLVNVKTKKKGWINIYSSKRYPNRTSETIYPTKKRADEGVSITEERVDCIEIEWEE